MPTAENPIADALRNIPMLSSLIEVSARAVVTKDAAGRVLDWNPAAERLFGWNKLEARGHQFPPPALREEEDFPDAIIEQLHETSIRSVETNRLRKDGSLVRVRLSVSPLKDAAGSVLGAVEMFEDSAEQARTERTERLFAEVGLLFSTGPDLESRLSDLARIIVPTLADCCIVHLLSEDGAVETIEVAAADADMDASLREMLAAFPYHPSRDQSIVAQVLRTGEAVLLQEDEVSAFGTTLRDEQDLALLGRIMASSVIAVPLLARGIAIGTITLVICLPRRAYEWADVAVAVELGRRAALVIDNARLYRAAQLAITQRDKVLSVVAHDVGNSLTVVNLAAALMREEMPYSGVAKKTQGGLAMIQDRVAIMTRLIQDLLDVSRFEAGHIQLSRKRQAAEEQVMRAIEAVRPLAVVRSIQISALAAEHLPPIYADGGRLLQVLENIIGNAMKFTPPNGRITIGVEQVGHWIQYSVADSGPGIEAGHLPHLFDRFWQADHDQKIGTGLGLSIAQLLVQTHGGRIWVESEVGKGTTFFFTMPVAKESDTRDVISGTY